ncbi:hypothetical protein GCM10010129_71180 [Streptomyces fumigatiscleroticus]|nr:hypothetical protein GCM10010129_71180 [Streptomyces fumigatiscleroticus]
MTIQSQSQSLEDRLTALLRDHFEVEEERILPEATFEDLELDSLAMMELLVVIEDEEGVRMPEDIPGIRPQTTLAETARIIARILAEHRDGSAAPAPAGQPPTEHDGTPPPLAGSTDAVR